MRKRKFFQFGFSVIATMFIVFLTAGLNAVNAQTAPALSAPTGAEDGGHNAEGIQHYNKAHWGKAEEHFREAVKADPKLAEAHYNLALSLDKLGKHREAVKFFGSAFKLAPDNPSIAGSKILKAHLGM